jgi:EAL domain-containing protein (putative c-di-GMP-specific phosphodiesterase class I)|tara:strand:+ start:850 stop:1122 length:273 start_codon:yes stop_codon:yes gene_type:complete
MLQQLMVEARVEAIDKRNIMNSKEFSLKIETVVREKRITYMEAVLLYCHDNGIDESTVSPLVSKSLKEKIKAEATNLRMLKYPRGGVLPV